VDEPRIGELKHAHTAAGLPHSRRKKLSEDGTEGSSLKWHILGFNPQTLEIRAHLGAQSAAEAVGEACGGVVINLLE
jgi:hypothetical protein